jgi:hypothetical protein
MSFSDQSNLGHGNVYRLRKSNEGGRWDRDELAHQILTVFVVTAFQASTRGGLHQTLMNGQH